MMTQEEEERCAGTTLFNRLQRGDASTGSGSAGTGLLIPRRRGGSVPTSTEVSTCPDMAVVHWLFYLGDLSFLRGRRKQKWDRWRKKCRMSEERKEHGMVLLERGMVTD